MENIYVPVKFGTKKKGMQAGEPTFLTKFYGEKIWKLSSKFACFFHWMMEKFGIHKEVANRVLEPYVWVEETITVEADALKEIANLRVHDDAQEDVRRIVEEMVYEMDRSTPVELNQGQWHVPYVVRRQVEKEMIYTDNTGNKLTLDQAIICSAARCARSSYANHDNSMSSYDKDIGLAKQLVGSEPMHLSPFEHQARPFTDDTEKSQYSSNFRNFFQQRKAIENSLWHVEINS
jgi:thymidylate synthase ThyX